MNGLPEGWDYKTFEELGIKIVDGDRGNNYPKQNDFLDNGYCLFLNAKNVTKRGFEFSEKKFITQEKDLQLRKGKLLKDDLILTTRGTVGNIAYYNDSIEYENLRINSGMVLLRASENIETNFLYKLMTSSIIQRHIENISFGSAQPQLTVKEIKKIQIPLPPLPEQKKIANILSTVDEKIALIDNQIDETETLKKGLMQKLLTEGIGHGEFKDSEVGRIPVGWGVVKLGNIIELLTDYHANGSYEKLSENVTLLDQEDYAVMIRTTNFEKKDFNKNLIYISEFAYNYLKKSKVYENDIIINKIANAGATYLMPKLNKPVSLAMNLFLLRFKSDIFQQYIYFQIKKHGNRLKSLASGTSTKTITKNDIRNFLIPLPPLKEQTQIAKILSTTDDKLEILRDKKEAFQKLKKGLMQKLLTGEIRVIV